MRATNIFIVIISFVLFILFGGILDEIIRKTRLRNDYLILLIQHWTGINSIMLMLMFVIWVFVMFIWTAYKS